MGDLTAVRALLTAARTAGYRRVHPRTGPAHLLAAARKETQL